jgi:hypothetical protein
MTPREDGATRPDARRLHGAMAAEELHFRPPESDGGA